jgi:hypothetical protein
MMVLRQATAYYERQEKSMLTTAVDFKMIIEKLQHDKVPKRTLHVRTPTFLSGTC